MVPEISNSIDQPNLTIWFRLTRLLDRTETSCADLFWAIFYKNPRQNLIRPSTFSNERLFDYQLFHEKSKNFNDVKPYHKLHTSLESSPRAERCQIFQKLYFGNVQFRKSNFIFTILGLAVKSGWNLFIYTFG